MYTWGELWGLRSRFVEEEVHRVRLRMTVDSAINFH